jgi:hypothetical protein
MFEYSRARAGHYAKVLFNEEGFNAAIEKSRWQAYPVALSMVAEMVEGTLRPHVGGDRLALVDGLERLVLAVFDRYPVPAAIGGADWAAMRDDVVRRLRAVTLHPPKPPRDIPVQFAETYFAMMPIHEKLRGADFPTLRNYLRVTLTNIHDELSKRLDAPAVAQALRAHGA